MRERILARREIMIAAALAAACEREPKPQPMPCLSQVYIPPDTGPADSGVAPDVVEAAALAPIIDAGAPEAAAPKPKTPTPMPCLTMTAPPPPLPKP